MKRRRIFCLITLAFLSFTARAGLLQPEVLFNFPRAAVEPYGNVIEGSDGSLYGTTYGGGSAGYGTVFKLATNGDLTTLVMFNGTNGAIPFAGLALGNDGNLYGTTSSGGASFQNDGNRGFGTIFKMTPEGTLTTLVSFFNTNGAMPIAGLTLGTNGSFYGTTALGGSGNDGRGTVFAVTTNGALTTLVSFPLDEMAKGLNPRGLTLGKDGNFYGTTVQGGNDLYGTVFKITPTGTLTTLASFNNANGSSPGAGLTLGNDGNFYGTTSEGGSHGRGTVFKVTPSGTLTTLVSFNDANGAIPYAALTLGSDGNFYGTTILGGSVGAGTAFKLTTNGVLTMLVSFTGGNGEYPVAQLTLGSGGSFYGTTRLGGIGYAGTVFRMATNGALTTLASFAASPLGNGPNSLVPGSDSSFYGTTSFGGSSQYGTVFKLMTNGVLTTLVSFFETNGNFPSGALVLDSDSNLYGTTSGSFSDSGRVFKLTTNGVLSTLCVFRGGSNGVAEGILPDRLVQGTDGSLYGTTISGGSSNAGTVFKLTLGGSLTPLVSFTGTNGWEPGSLMVGNDGNLYGTTYFGGTSFQSLESPGNLGYGTVFRLTTNGTLTTLVSFANTNGSGPNSLMHGPDGHLYGTTGSGGPPPPGLFGYGYGTVFRLTTNGALTTLGAFRDTNGSGPRDLVMTGDGNLYGITASGYFPFHNGAIFKLATNGTLTPLVVFDQLGGAPNNLTLAGDGLFYGTTSYGGSDGLGTIFRVNLSFPFIVAQPAGRTNPTGSNVTFFVVASGAESLSYYWRKNRTNLTDGGNISGAFTPTLTLSNVVPGDAGAYSVLVSNHLGFVESSNANFIVVQTVPLPEALDATNLVWSTGSLDGAPGWFGQTGTVHDGVDAAQSGNIAFLFQSSWVQTTVTGPGTLSFWWRVSNFQNPLALFKPWDGTFTSTLATDWEQRSIYIPAGTYPLRWTYSTPGPALGSGWLDQVQFTPLTPATLSRYEFLGDGRFRLRFDAAPGAVFIVLASTNLTEWTALGRAVEIEPGHFDFIDSDAPNHPTRFYQLQSP